MIKRGEEIELQFGWKLVPVPCTITLLFLLSAFASLPAVAQDSTRTDSLRHYDLNEIVVSDGSESEPEILTLQRIKLADIAQTDAATVSDITRLIPSAHLQTNSRGESLVYIRSAAERQVAVFFDGALLNVPWDNRVDLSLVPSSAIGSMSVAKGASSVLYGTNVVGGAINLQSRTSEVPTTELTSAIGSPEYLQFSASHIGSSGDIDYVLAAGFFDSDGVALSSEASLPYSQSGSSVRSNTDRQLINVFARASSPVSSTTDVAVSALYYHGEKGIAAEGHLDPAENTVRYWRMPELSNAMIIGNLQQTTKHGSVRATTWFSAFTQTIDQYESFGLNDLSAIQEDDDLTLGLRLSYNTSLAGGALKASLNANTSEHVQTDSDVVDNGIVSSTLEYRQNIVSAGAEYSRRIGTSLAVTAGGSIDGIGTPKTGDKPARDADYDYSYMAGLSHSVTDDLNIRFATGRKLRFPTPRELFGEALGRFLVNPDLKPESTYLFEFGIGWSSRATAFEVIPFYNRTHDTIDRRNVDVDGETLRQRVNLDGSRVYGIELVGAASPHRHVDISGSATWTNSRSISEDGSLEKLVEKPEWIVNLSVQLKGIDNFRLLVHPAFTGTAYSLDEDNTFVELPTALVLNSRLSYLIHMSSIQAGTELFFRVDNITDELVLPQAGLPGPGRSFGAGLSLSF